MTLFLMLTSVLAGLILAVMAGCLAAALWDLGKWIYASIDDEGVVVSVALAVLWGVASLLVWHKLHESPKLRETQQAQCVEEE